MVNFSVTAISGESPPLSTPGIVFLLAGVRGYSVLGHCHILILFLPPLYLFIYFDI